MFCPKCRKRAETIELKTNPQGTLYISVYCACGYSGPPLEVVSGQQIINLEGGGAQE